MHVCGGTEIDFFLVETFFFLFKECLIQTFCDRCTRFFPPPFSSFLNINRYELEGDLQGWRFRLTNEILCICWSSWRCSPLYTVIHRKLYVYMAASSLVCPGWFLCYCVTKLMWHQGGGKLQYVDLFTLWSPFPFLPPPTTLTLPPSHPLPLTPVPPLCPHSVKHCKRFELCKGLFLNTYFVYNVKPKSVYFGKKKKMFCVWNHSFI